MSHPPRLRAGVTLLVVRRRTSASHHRVQRRHQRRAQPQGITAGPDGNLWFAERDGRIGRITPLGVVTEFSTGISANAAPTGITAGPDGNLWFTEANGDRIGRITPLGVVTEFSIGITAGATPYGITAGADGNLWFTEQNGNRIGRITPLGVVTEFSTGISANAAPTGITAGPDGNLWFTEYNINRIGRITPLGVVTEFSAGISSDALPQGITAGPDGNLWFTEVNGDRIGRITPLGVVTEFSAGISAGGPAPSASRPAPMATCGSRNSTATGSGALPRSGSSPSSAPASAPARALGITAGPDGNLWFTENGGERIGRITTPPVFASAVSRKVHGGAGTFDLPLSLVATNPTTEPRIGPAQTIVFTFDKPISAATVTVTEGTATAGAPTFSGNNVIVNLTGVSNQQYVTISLTNVASTDGGTGGSGSVRIGFLLGDVNQNRVVTVADLGLVNAQLAQLVTAANYLKDVNASGTLTVADKGITNANLTKALPAVPQNQAPHVNAGPDQTITLPASASMTGSATDDGLPNPPATLTYGWSQVSGPGTVTFGSANNASTSASFSVDGIYVLRLTVSDSALASSDDVQITVNPASPQNLAPQVNAGPDQAITLPASASMSGSATDDGLPNPPAALTYGWAMVSGPGAVTFGSASSASTSASFSVDGVYVLRLTVSDSVLSGVKRRCPGYR